MFNLFAKFSIILFVWLQLIAHNEAVEFFNYNPPASQPVLQQQAQPASSPYFFNNLPLNYEPIFSYVGCFNDRREARDIGEKDFSFITKYNKSVPTVEMCVQLCAKDYYQIAGIQAFDECYCGNSYGKYNSTDNANCFFQCAGKYTCGGYNANSVYYISNVPQNRNNLESDKGQSLDILNPCLSSPCKNSGMCITLLDDKGVSRGFICRCTSPQDSGLFCEQRDFCFSNPCLNGGLCTNALNGYTCKCPSTWTGFNCNQPSINELSMNSNSVNCFDKASRCLNGGSCLKDMGEYFYSCKCMPGYSGPQCETYNPCTTRPCLNNGQCTAKLGSYFECNCTEQYYGTYCEKQNPCTNYTCANGGLCKINHSTNDYFCVCLGNFMGRNCNQCKPQFIGLNCDQCVNGFTGPNCDQLVNYCNPNPCMNGICLWDSNGHKCVCNEGWKGFNCSERNCLLKPCLNQGVCTATYENATNQMDYKCACPPDHYGEQCEFQNINPCYSNPCKLGEDCVSSNDGIMSYICMPALNNICETMKPCNKNSECIYQSENNTFYCKCLNGAETCEDSVALDTSTWTSEVTNADEEPVETKTGNNGAETSASDRVNTAKADAKSQSDIPKFGFNYENLYLLLPVGLVVVVVFFFTSIVVFFGIKARRRTARFNKNTGTNIRNIQYINDNMTFDENLKPIPNCSNSSIAYSASDKEYTEGYGRV